MKITQIFPYDGDLPISMDEIKNFLRISHSNDDDTIKWIAFASIEKLEAYLGRSILNKRYLCEAIPVKDQIILPIDPVHSIVGIKSKIGNRFIFLNNEDYFINPCSDIIMFYKPFNLIYIDYIAGMIDLNGNLDERIKYPILELIEYEYSLRYKKYSHNSLLQILDKYSILRKHKI